MQVFGKMVASLWGLLAGKVHKLRKLDFIRKILSFIVDILLFNFKLGLMTRRKLQARSTTPGAPA